MSRQTPESTVTILFTDVVGSTSLRTSRGDAAAQQIMRAHFDLVRQQIERHSGQEVKSLGDGFMVAFTSARQAVACAVSVQEAMCEHNRRRPDDAVEVRIGLNTGEAIHEGGDWFGAAVDAAHRIAAKADRGQILASDTVRSVIGPATDIRFADRGRFRLKGFPERWRLYEVEWEEVIVERALAAGAPKGTLLILDERTPFVGRESERAELRRLLEQAAGGQGSLVLISGEPGIGKTRLAEELMVEARERGLTALLGRCYEMAGAPPYIPFVEMLEAAARLFPPEALRDALGESAPEVATLMPELRRLFPDIGSPPQLPPEQERRYLFNGMLDFLGRAARAQPALLVLDDLHWADDSTLLLLRHIAGRLADVPLLLVGTYRDVELDAGCPLARALEELVRQRLAQRIALKRLPEGGVESMLRGLSGREPSSSLVKVIYGETEGNPFFVEEVFKHLAEEGELFEAESNNWRSGLQVVDEQAVPESVRLVIGRRLHRVSEVCRRVLTAAAVIGRGFTFELLETLGVVEVDALLDAVDEAERANLITASPDAGEVQFTFAHELIRQTLLSELSRPRRQQMHLRVAEALERVYARDLEDHAVDMAHHLQQAGRAADPERTVHYLTLAAEHALAQAAYEEAIRLYETALQALDRMEAPDQAQLCELLLAMGEAHRWHLDLAQSREAFRRAADIATKLNAPEQFARSALGLVWGTAYPGVDDDDRASVVEVALMQLEGDNALRSKLLSELARLIRSPESRDRRESLTREAVEVARRVNDPTALAWALNTRHDAMLGTRLEELVETAREVVRLAETTGNVEEGILGYEALAGDLLQLGDIRQADDAIDALARLAAKLGMPGYLAWVGDFRATRALMDGRFVDARRFAEEAFDLRGRGEVFAADRIFGAHMFGQRWLRGRLGRPDIDAANAFAERYPHMPEYRCALAFLYAELGSAGEARDELDVLLATDKFAGISGNFLLGLTLAAETCALLGDGRHAVHLYALLLPHAHINLVAAGVMALGSASRHLGLLATTMRRWDDAERHFSDALEMNTRMGARPWVAWTQHDYARMLLARRRAADRAKALELLTEALAAARDMGMVRLEQRAQEALDRLSGMAPAYPGGLTEREVEVLRLIAAGKSNQQIAGELVISLNTVARHVSNVFDKTSAANRTEAAAFANRHNLA